MGEVREVRERWYMCSHTRERMHRQDVAAGGTTGNWTGHRAEAVKGSGNERARAMMCRVSME